MAAGKTRTAGALAGAIDEERALLRHAGRALGAVRSEIAAIGAERARNPTAGIEGWLEYVGDMRAAALWLGGAARQTRGGRFAADCGRDAEGRYVRIRPISDPGAADAVERDARSVRGAALANAVATISHQRLPETGVTVLRLDLKHTAGGSRYAVTARVKPGGHVRIDLYEESAAATGGKTRRLRIDRRTRTTLAWLASAAADAGEAVATRPAGRF